MTRSADVSPTRIARTTGVLYVLVVLCGIVGEIVVTNVTDAGESAATVDSIGSHESLVGLGFVILLTRLLLLSLLILSLHRSHKLKEQDPGGRIVGPAGRKGRGPRGKRRDPASPDSGRQAVSGT